MRPGRPGPVACRQESVWPPARRRRAGPGGGRGREHDRVQGTFRHARKVNPGQTGPERRVSEVSGGRFDGVAAGGRRPGVSAPPAGAAAGWAAALTGQAAPHWAGLLKTARAFAIPMRTRFRGITLREGALIEGPAGWGEFSPFAEYGPRECARWLACAIEAATVGWPAPVRDRIPVNVTVPAVGPEQAHALVTASGCRTAKVKVAERGQTLADDVARVEAVRAALGPG